MRARLIVIGAILAAAAYAYLRAIRGRPGGGDGAKPKPPECIGIPPREICIDSI